jgi:hypothetical protein
VTRKNGRVSRRQLRWGVLYIGGHDWGKPGWKLTSHGHLVGFRFRRHGWLVMPLHRLAEHRGRKGTLG